jgi:hypothetical protein
MLSPTARLTRARPAARGGVASGISRRLRDERRLEARILERNNGQAIYAVLRDRRQRDVEFEAARRAADRDLAEADLALFDARQQLDELNEQLRELNRWARVSVSASTPRHARGRSRTHFKGGLR